MNTSELVGQYETTVIVEAMRYTPANLEHLIRFAGGGRVWNNGDETVVYTRTGYTACQPGDWVVRDRGGHLVVESPQDFLAIYRPANDLTG